MSTCSCLSDTFAPVSNILEDVGSPRSDTQIFERPSNFDMNNVANRISNIFD